MTDKTWWTHIGNRFSSNKDVVIVYFIHASSKKPILPMSNSLQRKARARLLKVMGLEKAKESDYRDRIFVALNTEMFPKRQKE